MTLTPTALREYWAAAAVPRPALVLGGGRWGRVWCDVLCAARGGGEGVVLLARANCDEAAVWRDERAGRSGVRIECDPDAALDAARAAGAAPFAIVASRPRDHSRDTRFCIASGVPALVEKPFTADPAEGIELIAQARAAGVALGLAVEFSLLPELHALAGVLGEWSGEAVLEWYDPPQEMRHGAVKREHDEVSVLGDLLPHAFSIFAVLAPKGEARLASVSESGPQGALDIAISERRFKLAADKAAAQRTRRFSVACDDGRDVTLDFSGATARLTTGEASLPIDPGYLEFPSTLRLELGAWLSALAGETPPPDIVADLPRHTALYAALCAARGA